MSSVEPVMLRNGIVSVEGALADSKEEAEHCLFKYTPSAQSPDISRD
jgi:hypothetical protein